VLPASEVVAHPAIPPDYLAGRNVSEQFRDVLDCFLDDEDLVGAGIFEGDGAHGDFLTEIAVRRGVTIRLASTSGDEVRDRVKKSVDRTWQFVVFHVR
jgi:hypothetical protein